MVPLLSGSEFKKRVTRSSHILSAGFTGYLRFRVIILRNRVPDFDPKRRFTSSLALEFWVPRLRERVCFSLFPEFQALTLQVT